MSLLESLGLLLSPSTAQITKSSKKGRHKTSKGCHGRECRNQQMRRKSNQSQTLEWALRKMGEQVPTRSLPNLRIYLCCSIIYAIQPNRTNLSNMRKSLSKFFELAITAKKPLGSKLQKQRAKASALEPKWTPLDSHIRTAWHSPGTLPPQTTHSLVARLPDRTLRTWG